MSNRLMNRVYIGEVEALELAQERNIPELPKNNGREIITVYSKLENELGKPNVLLGKDSNGFYTEVIE